MNENVLGYESESKLLMQFAIPSIISMVVSSLYNIVDQIFIGKGVGYLGNAATNVAFPLTTISLAICLMIGIGSSSRFSLNIGAKKMEEARQVAGNAVGLTIVASILYVIIVQTFLPGLLTVFGATDNVMDYAILYTRITTLGVPFLMASNICSNLIRADGSPKYSMMCMIIGAVINTILDPIFIFVFDLGIAGAAIATIIGQIVSAIIAIRYLFHFKNITLEVSDIHVSLQDTLSVCSIGMSAGINQLAILLVQIVLNNSLTYYGQFSVYGSDIPLAACGIVMKVNSILMAFIIGLSQGMQPIAGFNYGAKKYNRVRNVVWLTIGINFIISLIGWYLFQFQTAKVLSIFGSEDGLYFEFAIHFMKVFLALCIVNGVQVISSGFFSSIGKPLKGMILSLIRQVILLIPLLVILGHEFGLDGIMFAAPISDAIAFVVSCFFLIRETITLTKQHRSQDVI